MEASTGVQTNEGVDFGTLVWVEGEKALFRVDLVMTLGDRAELRVNLSPVPGTALISVVVAREMPTAEQETPVYLGRVLSVAEADRGRWEQYKRHRHRGGTLSDVSDVRDVDVALATRGQASQGGGQPRLGAGGAATFSHSGSAESGVNRAAMRDALKAAVGLRGAASSPASSPSGTASVASRPSPPPAVTPPSAPSPRLGEAARLRPPEPPPVRSAESLPRLGEPSRVRSSDSGASRGEPLPGLGEPSRVRAVDSGAGSPPPTARPAEPPLAAEPSAAAAPKLAVGGALPLVNVLPPDDPSWVLSPIAGRSYLEVRWQSEDAFSYDVYSQLTANVLSLTSDGRLLPSQPPIFVVLRYGGVVVQCSAVVTEYGPFGASYRLELTPAQHIELKRGARPASVMSNVPVRDR